MFLFKKRNDDKEGFDQQTVDPNNDEVQLGAWVEL